MQLDDINRAFRGFLRPADPPQSDRFAVVVPVLLVGSAVLVVLAASAMPPDYSWRIHSISESAAQGQLHAWVARLSFLAFGAAVLLLSVSMRRIWPRVTYWSGLVFAASMFGVAAFSHAPWRTGAEFDAFEDLLHSVFASGMGLAFVLGVLARLFRRGPSALQGRVLDIVAVLLATVVPLALISASSWGGALQRIMFAVGYVWFGRESLMGSRHVA